MVGYPSIFISLDKLINSLFLFNFLVNSSTPGEIYGDFIEILKEDYFPQRDILRDVQKKIKFIFKVGTTKEEYEEAFSVDEAFQKCNEDFRDMFFFEMIDDAEQRQKEDRKRKKLAIHDYCEYIDYKFYKKIGSITWNEAKEILSPHSTYKALNDEQLAEELFVEYKNSAAEKAIVVNISFFFFFILFFNCLFL